MQCNTIHFNRDIRILKVSSAVQCNAIHFNRDVRILKVSSAVQCNAMQYISIEISVF